MRKLKQILVVARDVWAIAGVMVVKTREILALRKDNSRLAQALAGRHGLEVWFFWQPNIVSKEDRSKEETRIHDDQRRPRRVHD